MLSSLFGGGGKREKKAPSHSSSSSSAAEADPLEVTTHVANKEPRPPPGGPASAAADRRAGGGGAEAGGGGEGEGVPLLIVANGEAEDGGGGVGAKRGDYGGTSDAGGDADDGERFPPIRRNSSCCSSRSNLKANLKYSNPNSSSVHTLPSPAPSQTSRRRPSRSARRQHEHGGSWLRSSLTSLGGHDHDAYAAGDGDSIILAPDDLSLPPETQLLGSSKIVAKARLAEIEKVDRDRSLSWGNLGDVEATQGAAGTDDGTVLTMGSARPRREPATLAELEEEYLEKTRSSFYVDAITFAEGTIPQSIAIAFCVGVVCGVVAFVYYAVNDYFLELIWDEMPEWFVIDRWPEELYVLWIPLCTVALSLCCGLSIYYLGEPGDLAYTIQCIHEKGYKATSHIVPMVAASQFTILAGASLGPEAPLVAICAATAGFLSRKVFKQRNRNVVRKHTFMGMSGALAAFFGVPLGGSIFALEVASRFGVEYFEHLAESIFAGEICVVVFRALAGLPLGSIWKIVPEPMAETHPTEIVLGAGIGLLGAGVAYLWANFHWRLMAAFRDAGLLDDENRFAVRRVLVGAVAVAGIGVLVPHTMFWGEFEIGTIATLSPAKDLPHVWPTSGLLGFEMDSMTNCLIVGFCKLVAISFTVAGGFRGGYIFPFFAAGAAFGRALCFAFPSINPAIATLCFAAGINVAITRTALATSLILAQLSGELHVLPVLVAASLVSLFATGYMPFIKSQLARSDIDFSLYYRRKTLPRIQDSYHTLDHAKDAVDED